MVRQKCSGIRRSYLEVEMAIDTLIQYSMIEEIKSDDGHYFLQLPYVAFAFGEKKIKVSPQKYLIANDVKTLRLFGVTNIDDKKISLGKNFLKYLSSIEQNDDFVVHHKKILEKICLTHHEGWKQLTIWALEINNKQFNELASEFITRYLEGDESEENKHKAWSIYALISERLHKPYEQILGLTHASDYSEITIDELSNNTNRINQIFKQNEIMPGESVKQELLDKLFNVVYSIKQKADATACSRFAWLALHLNKEKEARELTELGLRNESDNQYCIRLKRKFTNS